MPSSDDKVYTAEEGLSDIIIGRAPYDQANLIAIEKEKTRLHGKSAEYLREKAFVMQYSFAGEDPQRSVFFAKGLLAVIPDEHWPEEVKENIVLSTADIKTYNSWKESATREKFAQDIPDQGKSIPSKGILIAIEIPPGASVAIPVARQQRLCGDYDGDKILLIEQRPELFKQYTRA